MCPHPCPSGTHVMNSLLLQGTPGWPGEPLSVSTRKGLLLPDGAAAHPVAHSLRIPFFNLNPRLRCQPLSLLIMARRKPPLKPTSFLPISDFYSGSCCRSFSLLPGGTVT